MNFIYKRPRLLVGIILVITVFFAFQLTRIELDNNNYRFIPKSNPARVTAEAIDKEFGNQILVLVGFERRYDSIIEADFLHRLSEFTTTLESMPLVKSVQSIVSADFITGRDSSIVVETVVPKNFSGTEAEVQEVKDRLLSWDMYDRALISDDLKSTQIIIALDVTSEEAGKPEALAVFKEIKKDANKLFSEKETRISITGLPVFSATINDSILSDLWVLIPLVVLVVLLSLFFSFKRGFAVIISLVTVIIATIWSVGAMPLFGVKLSILTTVLPVILVAVGSAYGIHVVSHYIDARDENGELNAESHKKLVLGVVKKMRRPVFLAALTTFVGFISFSFTSVIPIREFGYFASFGVIVSFVIAITMIPSLFLIRGPKPLKPKMKFGKRLYMDDSPHGFDSAIADSFIPIIRGKRKIVGIALIIVLFSIYGLTKIVVDNILVEYFKKDTDIALSDSFIREKFGGSKLVSVVVKSEEPGGVLAPDVLTAMDGLAMYLEKDVPEVGKVTSFTDLVKRINQVYNADESPLGLKAITPVSPVSSASAQGESFGFGDFGFGDFGSFESDSPDASQFDLSEDLDSRSSFPLSLEELAVALDASVKSSSVSPLNTKALVNELKKAVNLDGASYYEIPSNPEKYGKKDAEGLKSIISNYMMLLSGDISSFANDPLEPTEVRMNVQMRTIGQIDTDRAVRAINEYVEAKFPKNVEVIVGGFAMVEGALNELVVQSQLVSVGISLLMVFLILSVSYKSAAAGLIAIVPLAFSILINFAVMGFTGIKLNIGTALVASVAVGVGVDYIIHYLAAYSREYRASGGQGDFLVKTYLGSGKAILINAVSVGAGFAVLGLSNFNILAQFGLLIALTMATSSLSALIILPVLLNWIKPAFLKKGVSK